MFSREVFESRRTVMDVNPGFSIAFFVSKTGCGQEISLYIHAIKKSEQL
jgi:hypothetical protein